MKRIFTSIIAILAAGTMLAACSDTATGNASGGNYLTVGVRKNLANFSTYNEEADTYFGFEDSLAAKLAEKMGYDGVKFTGLDPEDREEALQSGQVDCLIAAFSYTEERASNWTLSQPYYYDEGRVMIEKSTLFTDYADLKGAKVAVRNGTDAADHLAEKLLSDGLITQVSDLESFLTVVPYDSYEEMNLALEYGDVDALCADGCITLSWLDSERTYFAQAYSEEDYVIASAKDSPLGTQIDEALTSLSEDGTLAQLEEMWGIANEEN